MTCPYFKETRVWGCRSAHVRKLIPHSAAAPPGSLCLDGGYHRCSGFVGVQAEPGGGNAVCPNLEQSVVQYCAAAPVTKFIPYSEAVLIRCGSGAFRYCDQFLDQMGPGRAPTIDGQTLNAPEGLYYAGRHWWFDLPDDGPWHAGLDAFTSRLAGPVDRIAFIPASPGAAPAVVLTAASRDFTFPLSERLPVSATNLQLRLHPARVFDSPYDRGWIFQGVLPGRQRAELRQRLASAAEARLRMEEDARLVNERLHQLDSRDYAALADGGLFDPGILARLDRDSALALMHELAALPGPERT